MIALQLVNFTQPANTIITDIKIFCVTAPVIGTGDIGYEVGTSSSGAQIVAAQTDEIFGRWYYRCSG